MQFNLYWQQEQQEEKQEEEEEEADCCVFCHWRHLGFQCCFSGGQRALHCIALEERPANRYDQDETHTQSNTKKKTIDRDCYLQS